MKKANLISTMVFLIFTEALYGQSFTSLSGVSPFNINNLQAQVIDFDNDGDDDVIGNVLQNAESTKLYSNNGSGVFTDVTAQTGFPSGNSRMIADLDKNGFDDVIIFVQSASAWTGEMRIYFNQNGMFQYNANCASYNVPALFSSTLSNLRLGRFEDANNDGIYDLLYSVSVNGSVRLMMKRGIIGCGSCSYSFDTAAAIEIWNSGQNGDLGYHFIDFDNDQDFDLITATGTNQYSTYTYRLLLNNGAGIYTLSTNNFGIGNARISGFGLAGELNNDGVVDLVSGAADCCVGSDLLTVFFSNGLGSYTASTSAMPKATDAYYGGASFIDMNMDGRQDVFWLGISAIGSSAVKCYLNNGNQTFTETAGSWGVSQGLSYGCCPIPGYTNGMIIDINNDKKPDLDIHSIDWQSPYTAFQNWTYLNNLPNQGVKLRLKACSGLSEGYGAKVSYKVNNQWNHQFRYSKAENSYQPFMYLGCGSAAMIDSLVVHWMGGQETVLTNINTGTYLKIEENANCLFNNSGTQQVAVVDSVMQGSTYLFGSQLLSQAGTYTNTFTSALGCDSIVTLTLSVYEPPITCNITAPTTTLCAGESVTLSVNTTGVAGASSQLPANLQQGLVAYYPFNGNANDESGNGNDGVVDFDQVSITSDRFNSLNGAFEFIDALGGVQISNFSFPHPNYTVSLWCNVFFDGNAVSSKNIISHDWNNGGEMLIYMNEPDAQTINFDCRPNIVNSISFPVSSNTWYHFVAVRSGNQFSLFANGVNVGSDFKNLAVSAVAKNLYIGGDAAQNLNDFSRFNGKIDDIAIYNRALSPSEIQQLYTAQTYAWSNSASTPTITVTPTASTTYSCNVTQGNQTCTASVDITVNAPATWYPDNDGDGAGGNYAGANLCQALPGFPGGPTTIAKGVSDNQFGYVISGDTYGLGFTNNCWKLDPAANSWSAIANLPVSINQGVTFQYNNHAYVGLGNLVSGIYKYDNLLNVWSLVTNIPDYGQSNWSGSCFVIGDNVYFVFKESQFVKLNMSTLTWTQLSNFPGGNRATGTGFALNGKGYFGLGYFGTQVYANDLWEYNPETNSWTQKSNLPSFPRYACTAVVQGGRAYFLGGEKASPNPFLNEVWMYNPINDTWTAQQNYPSGGRNYVTAFVVNDHIYSGLGSSGYNTDFWKWNSPALSCTQPVGFVSNTNDCNDNINTTYPNAEEICFDQIDNNCNGTVDENCAIFGCINPNACNFNPQANTDDGSCILPQPEVCNNLDDNCNNQVDEGLSFVNYYIDNDGDGQGTGTAINACTSPGTGYVTSTGDCNDNNNAINSNATEICDALDNDCDGQINEGLMPGDISFVNVNTALFPTCSSNNLFSANLNNGSNSAIIDGTGPDLWYRLTAQHNTLRAGLSAASGSNSVGIYQDFGGCLQLLQSESETTTGNQTLLTDALQVGATYYIAVHQIATPTNTSAKICFNHLVPSTCDHVYSGNTGVYSNVCLSFKAQFRANASNYVFNVLSAGQNGSNLNITPWSYTSPTASSIVTRLGTLLPANMSTSNRVYTINVPVVYNLSDAAGNISSLTANATSTCTVTLQPETGVTLRTTDRCPNVKTINQSVATDRSICGTLRYEWEFTQTAPTAGLPVTVLGGLNSTALFLNTVPGMGNGKTYNVRVRPIHTTGEVGNYGAVQCMKTTGAGMILENHPSSAGAELPLLSLRAGGEMVSLFPNPTVDGQVTLLWKESQEGQKELVLRDVQGRVVWKQKVVIEGNVLELDWKTLDTGIYLLEVDGQTMRVVKG